jgi:hypothetical protein
LRVALAGALLEMQGAKLSLDPTHQAKGWSAWITFPCTSSAGERRRLRESASPTCAESRGGSRQIKVLAEKSSLHCRFEW